MQTMGIIKFILAAWSFGVIGVLVLFLARVAYFYEKTSGQRVGYYLLIVPALLLAAGAVWYLVRDVTFALAEEPVVAFTGEPVGDLLLLTGGMALFLLGGRLQELMTGERR